MIAIPIALVLILVAMIGREVRFLMRDGAPERDEHEAGGIG